MIKFGSNTHQVLLILRSANGAPKTVSNITMISTKTKSSIMKAIKVLHKNGLVEEYGKHQAWQITNKGIEMLVYLARQQKTIKGRDDVDYNVWRTAENVRAARNRALARQQRVDMGVMS